MKNLSSGVKQKIMGARAQIWPLIQSGMLYIWISSLLDEPYGDEVVIFVPFVD